MVLETERLILRPFKESDAADLFEYLNKPMVNCFADMKINSMQEAEEEARMRMNDEFYLEITTNDTGKVIGEIFAHPEDEPGNEHLEEFCDTYSPCWMLNPNYHGRGYAYGDAYVFVDYLFAQKGARRLYAYTEDYNIASQKLCEKLGMRREGLFLEFISFVNDENGNPIYENTYQYAILKKEWENNNK